MEPPERGRVYGWVLTIAYGPTFVYGLAVADPNVLALNQGDNWLHATSARWARERTLASP